MPKEGKEIKCFTAHFKGFFDLRLLETLENDDDEEIDKDQSHHYHVTVEIQKSYSFTTTALDSIFHDIAILL